MPEADTPPIPSTSPNPSERARDGLEHLQSAARELIAAARAALDVAEGIIDDPDAVSSMVGRLAERTLHAHSSQSSPDDDESVIERITVT
jgi:hypothetical protein